MATRDAAAFARRAESWGAFQTVGHQLITSLSYISTANTNLADPDFQAILDEANERNSALGLTGLLAFNGLNFMQILEGSEASVNLCIGLIQADRRHHGMIIFDRREREYREFPDWKMAGVRLNGDGNAAREGLDSLLSAESVCPETRKHFESFQSFGTPAA